MNKNIPDIIKQIGFDFSWKESKVWALDLPTANMSISELSWHFEIPFWNINGEYNLKPIDVINNPELYEDEYNRIISADLSFPLDIMENKGRYLLLDRLHRLAKAYILGNSMVNVRIVPRALIESIKS